jgi:Tc toxin complex TcA C-terminal TcB-binding domain
LNNRIRTKATGDFYAERPDGDDPRFLRDHVLLQSIATSSAQNDSGMFELNFRDERYLPFEGAGAISRRIGTVSFSRRRRARVRSRLESRRIACRM